MQLLYLAIRFRWTLGAAAVIAMAHDVLILVGVFAWLGKPIDGVFLAALLTVIGYSVNDSVVVFDRVRELWGTQRKLGFARVVNSAIVQTVPRTVNTGLGAVFILVGPGRPRWRLAHRLRAGPAHRHRRGHVLVDVHGVAAGDRARAAQPVTAAPGEAGTAGSTAVRPRQQRGGGVTLV